MRSHRGSAVAAKTAIDKEGVHAKGVERVNWAVADIAVQICAIGEANRAADRQGASCAVKPRAGIPLIWPHYADRVDRVNWAVADIAVQICAIGEANRAADRQGASCAVKPRAGIPLIWPHYADRVGL